jgi:hypothetical protein
VQIHRREGAGRHQGRGAGALNEKGGK